MVKNKTGIAILTMLRILSMVVGVLLLVYLLISHQTSIKPEDYPQIYQKKLQAFENDYAFQRSGFRGKVIHTYPEKRNKSFRNWIILNNVSELTHVANSYMDSISPTKIALLVSSYLAGMPIRNGDWLYKAPNSELIFVFDNRGNRKSYFTMDYGFKELQLTEEALTVTGSPLYSFDSLYRPMRTYLKYSPYLKGDRYHEKIIIGAYKNGQRHGWFEFYYTSTQQFKNALVRKAYYQAGELIEYEDFLIDGTKYRY